MNTERTDAYTVTSLDDLAKIYAKPLARTATKETDYITETGRAFIAASPFLVLATIASFVKTLPFSKL